MNCRSFEKQTADWISRRLTVTQAESMAAHQKICPTCKRIAAGEAQMHRVWQESTATPCVTDLWPCVAARIDVPGQGIAGTLVGAKQPVRAWLPRLVPALLVSLAVLSTLWWGRPPHDQMPVGSKLPAHSTAVSSTLQADDGRVPREIWPVLSDVPQSNPRVDDPVGANMEDVWTYLKTENK